MIKFKNKSIRQKLFIITSISLFLSAFVIYLIVYAVLPSYYYKYKRNTIDSEIQTLIAKVRKEEFQNAKLYIDNFANRNNVSLSIHDNLGRIIYIPSSYITVIDKDTNTQFILVPGKYKNIENTFGFPQMNYSSGFYTSSQSIQFKDSAFPLILTVSAALQPIDEASKVILNLAPYILFIILGISSVGAYIYSRFIADPLIKVHKTAKKMAKLDFETICIVKSDDEIGELASSLNELSKNLKKTMDELENTNKQLKSDIEREREIESKRREFVATISHELKSPIAAAKGQIEGMINNIGVFKDREKYLRRSYSIINNMEKLVNEILYMSRIENYDFSPKLAEVNLSNLIKKIVGSEEYLSFSKKLTLEVDIQEGIIILADEKLILKALSNIINNAMKYSPEGEKIIINLKLIDNNANFSVINTGAQIDENDIKEIFKPFYRVEKSRNRSTGGSGLGLYIVKGILETHGVEYNLKSYDNKVEFTVKFHL
ncbi:HAMP domain-containing sensor histidine kinase [Clostridium cylindrosporum]|uniref:histidine kinase n=1 Tax=Clostridium cylindrosporum DSM 605 TaxID=1121307 RepID=A0A0J8DA41_CLOCY|nr:HAMP domain-containing sensor histidine kinase [Clostridium cylindrosporum]KMT21184.1 sensor protein VanSB [Clostridium cylindrosporum DSM 605]